MGSLAFGYFYLVSDDTIVSVVKGPYKLIETVDDGVFDIDLPERIFIEDAAGNQTAASYLGVSGNDEIAVNVGRGDYGFFSNVGYGVPSAAPAFKAVDFALCFASGTRIETEGGLRPVEALVPGDLVLTRDNGLRRLRWIGSRQVGPAELMLHPNLRPVRIAAGTLGNDRDLVVSPEHRMLLSGWRTEAILGIAEALVPARSLVNDSTIRQETPQDGVTYWHLLFDSHEILRAEGCWSESFHPGMAALGALDRAAREELFALFPELDRQTARPTARPVVAGQLAAHLI